MVNDPGHGHSYTHWPYKQSDLHGTSSRNGNPDAETGQTELNKTGITVDNLPAKSAIDVSIDVNDAGEHYPLVYVLMCQKLRADHEGVEAEVRPWCRRMLDVDWLA